MPPKMVSFIAFLQDSVAIFFLAHHIVIVMLSISKTRMAFEQVKAATVCQCPLGSFPVRL